MNQFFFRLLGSPVLVDVNNDGHVEVLVAVSYYFDKEEYSSKELDFDPSMYVAGGLALWDLQVRFHYILFYFISHAHSDYFDTVHSIFLWFSVFLPIFIFLWELNVRIVVTLFNFLHFLCLFLMSLVLFDHDNYCCGTYR